MRRLIYRLGRGRAENVVRQIVPYLAVSDRILDVGAGTCNVCELLRERGLDVTPIDVEDLSFVGGLRPRLYDGEHLPFDDDSFDVTLVLAVLHHTEDPQAVLAEAARVARRLVVMEDVHRGVAQKAATRVLDSFLNLEFSGHPHNNKSDAEWRRIFETLDLKVRDATCERWLAITSATYHLERQGRSTTRQTDAWQRQPGSSGSSPAVDPMRACIGSPRLKLIFTVVATAAALVATIFFMNKAVVDG